MYIKIIKEQNSSVRWFGSFNLDMCYKYEQEIFIWGSSFLLLFFLHKLVFIYNLVAFIYHQEKGSYYNSASRGHILLFHQHDLRRALVGVLRGVSHKGHQGQPGLLGSRNDLVGRQDKAVAASVPQLKGVGVLDSLVIGPVHSGSTSLICKVKCTRVYPLV